MIWQQETNGLSGSSERKFYLYFPEKNLVDYLTLPFWKQVFFSEVWQAGCRDCSALTVSALKVFDTMTVNQVVILVNPV